jgi:hypothetical protein
MGPTTIHTDEAFDVLIERLVAIPQFPTGFPSNPRSGTFGCDVWIPDVAIGYWGRLDTTLGGDPSRLREEHCQPFYDAAWELCRIGVLRPGEAAPIGNSMSRGFHGDGYSITAFGRQWIQDANRRSLVDPSRLSGVLRTFEDKFGVGYSQRAQEAVSTYRTGNYLAACVMAGAAAESILLSVAIARKGDEAKVLSLYRTSGGRSRVTKNLTAGLSSRVASHFETALQVLSYWRDDAGHGTMTTISEIEAHASLTQLLRFAQFSADHWTQLTA